MNGIKSMYVSSLVCVRLKWGENDCFRIDSTMKQGCILFPWLFNVFIKMMVGHFVKVCRRGLKVNAIESKAALNVEEGLKCEVHMDGM